MCAAAFLTDRPVLTHPKIDLLVYSTTVEEMLGNQGVTESNMMQYLGIIEQRTIEILQMYAASQMANGMEGNVGLPRGEGGLKQPPAPKFNVQPPVTEDFSSGDESGLEDEDRPLTREELQKKSLRILSKKEKHVKIGKPIKRN